MRVTVVDRRTLDARTKLPEPDDTFGLWTVGGDVGRRHYGRQDRIVVRCRCLPCGSLHWVRTDLLRRGDSTGCLSCTHSSRS